MKKSSKVLIEIDGRKIPAKIYREWRKDVRANIGKSEAILRLPHGLTTTEEHEFMVWFRDYIAEQLHTNPEIEERFFGKGYQDGETITVGEREYLLRIRATDKKTHSARLRGSVIYLNLVEDDLETHKQKAIRHLISRTVGKDHLPWITRRVMELNQLYFQQPVKSVNLKYNLSNWGSCSSEGNVNLSTRLLFAPPPVIDYVIIHELAHLIELNHSSRFWKLVEDAMPQYKRMERWLKDHGEKCNF